MTPKITGPRAFFEELNALLRSIDIENASPQTKDALAKVCSYLNPHETEVPKLPTMIGGEFYVVSEMDRIRVCEAADILRYLAQGHGATPDEARDACSGLLAIGFHPIAKHTWESA